MRPGSPRNPNTLSLHGPATLAASLALMVGANALLQADMRANGTVTTRSNPPETQPNKSPFEESLFAASVPTPEGSLLHPMPYARYFGDDPKARQVDPADIRAVVKHLESLHQKGADDLAVSVFGSASDEARLSPNGGIGHPDPENQELAGVRAEAYATALREALGKTMLVDVDTPSPEEVILSQPEQQVLSDLAQKHGLTVGEAAAAFNDGRELPADLRHALQKALAEQRGVEVVISGLRPFPFRKNPSEATTARHLANNDQRNPWALLALPILRRRRESPTACKGELELYRGPALVPSSPASQAFSKGDGAAAKPRLPIAALPPGKYMTRPEALSPPSLRRRALEAAPQYPELLPAEADRIHPAVSLKKTAPPSPAE